MKRIALFIFLIMLLVSCGSNTSSKSQRQGSSDPSVSEKYEPSDEELYAACADLKGIGPYLIGSKFTSILNNKEYRSNTSSYNRESDLYYGHWGQDFWAGKGYKSYEEKREKEKFIVKEARGKIKQLHCNSDFKIGDIKFTEFDMAFLNDTLVAISFMPEYNEIKSVLQHFIEKYGNGRGSLFESKRRSGETYTNTEKEDHLWANETVEMKYDKYLWYQQQPGKSPSLDSRESFIIYNKLRFHVFETTLKGLADKYEELQQESKSNSLNSL